MDHPLAREPEPIVRATLEPYIQLVLTDRTPLTQNFSGGIVGHHIWRFADLSTRLEFLLAGFGWCNMPLHMVRDHIAAGRLKALKLAEQDPFQFRVHVMRLRGSEIGLAGRWLIDDLRRLLTVCPEAYRAAQGRRVTAFRKNEGPSRALPQAPLRPAPGEPGLASSVVDAAHVAFAPIAGQSVRVIEWPHDGGRGRKRLGVDRNAMVVDDALNMRGVPRADFGSAGGSGNGQGRRAGQNETREKKSSPEFIISSVKRLAAEGG